MSSQLKAGQLYDIGPVVVDMVHIALIIAIVVVFMFYCQAKQEGFVFGQRRDLSIPIAGASYGGENMIGSPAGVSTAAEASQQFNPKDSGYAGSAGRGTVSPWDMNNMGITSTTSELLYRQAVLGF